MTNESLRNSLEVVDLLLTQSLERYQDMEPRRIPLAIMQEWGPQTSALLDHFIARAARHNRYDMPRFILRPRIGGGGSYFDLPRDFTFQL